jgi:DNA-binding response OmpR family regulator
MRLLLVEDSSILRASLRAQLTEQGWSVDEAVDGAAAQSFIAAYRYDVVVLDLMLPVVDGLDVLRALRTAGVPTRVLVLSARDQVADRVEALNAGADDYMVKPFAFSELNSRLLALMRRSVEAAPPRVVHGRLSVDPAARLVRVDDTPLALTPKEYALLDTLLRNRGAVQTRDRLFEQVYDSRSNSSDKVIEVLVSTLRGKLAQAGITDLIETRRGFGYVVS